jgi:Ca2+-binding RTX toxin-like protein
MRRVALLLTVMAAALVLASGVALAVTKIGTNGHDVLKGTDGKDNLLGLGGQDDIFGKGGSDNLVGGPGKDNVLGVDVLGVDERRPRPGGGDKNLEGGPGNDFVFSGKGSDNIVGGEGNDLLFECCLREFSKDTLSGGSGNDVIDVSHKPAVQDVVTCGSGFDRVLSDRADRVAPDCEKVVVVHGSKEDVLRQVDRFFKSIPQSFFRGLPPNPFR